MFGRIGANLKKTGYYLKRNGIRATWYAARERMEQKQDSYEYEKPTQEQLLKQEKECCDLRPPLFSILVPAFHTPERYLKEMIESVLAQTYPFWELVLADASKGDLVESVTKSYQDARIHYIRLSENGGISENSNQGLQAVEGEYVGLLDHDDLLTPDALYHMYQEIKKGKLAGTAPAFLYSDEDKCDGTAKHFYEPHQKEDFNLDLLLSNNYICHFLVMKTELMKKLGFRKMYDGAQDYDLVLRAVKELMPLKQQDERIVHVGKVLYHWRCHEASTAANPKSKEYAYEAGKCALQDFATSQGWQAKAEHLSHLGFYRLCFENDIFCQRKDLGAVGGKLLHRGRIKSGRMDEQGNVFYENLPLGYSGIMHRAVLTQDAMVVDLRNIKIAPQCEKLFQELVGVPYVTLPETGIFDISTLPKKSESDLIELSIRLCMALQKEGYRILWDPCMLTRI